MAKEESEEIGLVPGMNLRSTYNHTIHTYIVVCKCRVY